MAPNHTAAAATGRQFALPTQVIGPADVGRLAREVDDLNNALLTQTLQKASETQLPKLSLVLDQLVELNQLQLLAVTDRQALVTFLKSVSTQAPVLHISFSTDPSAAFMEKLVAWLRREIHPLALVTIGLQPNIGAGCVLRSVNRQFDFSLRQDMLKKRDLLLQLLDAQIPEPVSNIAAITMQLATGSVGAAASPSAAVMAQPALVAAPPSAVASAAHAASVHQTIHQPAPVAAQPAAQVPQGVPA